MKARMTNQVMDDSLSEEQQDEAVDLLDEADNNESGLRTFIRAQNLNQYTSPEAVQKYGKFQKRMNKRKQKKKSD